MGLIFALFLHYKCIFYALENPDTNSGTFQTYGLPIREYTQILQGCFCRNSFNAYLTRSLAPGLLRRPSAHYIPSASKNATSEKVANRLLTHSAALRSAPFVHRLFAFTSKLARWPLSKLAGKQCKHSQLQSLRDRFAYPSLCASACFREKQIVVWESLLHAASSSSSTKLVGKEKCL